MRLNFKDNITPIMKKWILLLLITAPFFLQAQSGKTNRALFDNKTIGEIRLTLPSKKWSDGLDSMRLYGMGMMKGTATIDGSKYEGWVCVFAATNRM